MDKKLSLLLNHNSNYICGINTGLLSSQRIITFANDLSRGDRVYNKINKTNIFETLNTKYLPYQRYYDSYTNEYKSLSKSSWVKLDEFMLKESYKHLPDQNTSLSNDYVKQVNETLSLWMERNEFTLFQVIEKKDLIIFQKALNLLITTAVQKSNTDEIGYMNFSITLGTSLLDLYVDYNKNMCLLPYFLRKYTFNEVIERELYSSLFADFPKKLHKILYFLFLNREIVESLKEEKVNKALLHHLGIVNRDVTIYERMQHFNDFNLLKELNTFTCNYLSRDIKIFTAKFGLSLVNLFFDHLLILKSPLKRNINNQYFSQKITFNCPDIIHNMPQRLPRLAKPIAVESKNYLHPNPDMFSMLHNKAKTRINTCIGQKYTLNKPFLLDFFTTVFESLNIIKSGIPVLQDLINNNMPLVFSTETLTALRFFSNIYKINFEAFFTNLAVNEKCQSFSLECIIAATDFNTFEHQIQESNDTISDSSTFKNAIRNKIFSIKLDLNEIFCQLTIMSHFEYFYYDWFADARFRIYFAQASLNPYKPFVRSFLQFYHSPDIDKLSRIVSPGRSSYTQKVAHLLKIQLVSWLKSTIIPKSSNLRDLLTLKPTWKLGSLFFISRLFQDFYAKDHNYTFFYWKDTSSSGYQNYSILTKSLRLAQASSLSKSTNPDIYTKVSNRILNEIKTIRNIIKALSPELLLLAKNINFNASSEINVPPNFNAKYKYFLSQSKLKEINKHASTDNEKFIYLFIIKQMHKFVRLLKLHPNLVSYFNRSLWKRPTMTDLYASSRKGRSQQCIDKIIETALINGEWINNSILSILKQLLFRLDYVFTTFLNEHYPEKNYVKDAIRTLCNKKSIKPIIIDSINGIFLFEPTMLKDYRFDYRNAMSKTIRQHIKLNTDKLHYSRFSTSFTSNLLQAVDAIIVGIFQQEILKFQQKHGINIPFFTVHDCWFIHPVYCLLLDTLCLNAVKIFFDMHFEEQFKNIPLLYDAFKHYAKENPKNILTKDNINNPDFIKH